MSDGRSAMNPVEQHLRAMRSLLSDESKWTQGVWMRDSGGREVDPRHREQSVCWCVEGASVYVDPKLWDESEPDWQPVFSEVIGTTDIPHWNDAPGRTFAEVAAALDRAIELAAERGV